MPIASFCTDCWSCRRLLKASKSIAADRGNLMRDQPGPAPLVAGNSLSALRLYSGEQDQRSPDVSHNGCLSRHSEHEEPDVKQEIDEGVDAVDVGTSTDHGRHNHELHEYASATEQEFEGFDTASQTNELHRHDEDAQREEFGWWNEERENDDDPTHRVQERPNYSIDDIGLAVEEEQNDFALVTGILPEALKQTLEELFNEIFPAEMEIRKEKESRRLNPRKKEFLEHWNGHAENTSACFKQFLKANRTTYAIDDKDYIACRTCLRARLPCVRWSVQAQQFYVCLLPKVSREGGDFDETLDYIYSEKKMSGELE